MKYSHGKVSNKAKFEAFKKLRRGLKKTDYFMTLIKRKSLLLEALEIVTGHWDGWVSKEDITIAKQTFRVVLYSLRFSCVGLLPPQPV